MNSVCNCTKFHTNIVQKLSKDWFSGRDYDDVVWRSYDDSDSKTGEFHHFDSRGFTKNTEDVTLLCPQHSSFFIYIAGIIHVRPHDIQRQIEHAWYHEKSGTLKILVKSIHDPLYQRMIQGLSKAWRGYSNNPNSCVYVYNEELGGFDGEEIDDYEDSMVDAWHIMSSLGSSLWGANSFQI